MNDRLYAELTEKIEELEEMRRELTEEHHRVETLAEVRERVKNKPLRPKYATGIDFLDEKLGGGFSHGTFINIAGGNFTGKTHLILTILSNICRYRPVLFFSFEMYEDRIARRTQHFNRDQDRNFYIEQDVILLDRIEAIIKEKAKSGVDFVAIDSRMKIVVPGAKEEYIRNSEISRRLSKLTQETGIVLIVINQTSEQDLRSGRPSLKGSGDQAYDSDIILYIAQGDDNGERVLICDKDRDNGKKWAVKYTLADLGGYS